MRKLEAAFKNVGIIKVYKESSYEIVDGVMVIKDNSESTIKITPQDIDSINQITREVRNKIIS